MPVNNANAANDNREEKEANNGFKAALNENGTYCLYTTRSEHLTKDNKENNEGYEDSGDAFKYGAAAIKNMEQDSPNKFKTAPNTFLFWSGCRVEKDNKDFLKSEFWKKHIKELDKINEKRVDDKIYHAQEVSKIIAGKSYYTIRELINERFDYGIDTSSNETWTAASEAFAKHAEGTVFFVEGLKKRIEKNFWENTERPTLMKNNDVHMIAEIDFFNPNKVKSIILKGGLTADTLKDYGLPTEIFKNLGGTTRVNFEYGVKINFENAGITYAEVDALGKEKPLKAENDIKKPRSERDSITLSNCGNDSYTTEESTDFRECINSETLKNEELNMKKLKRTESFCAKNKNLQCIQENAK